MLEQMKFWLLRNSLLSLDFFSLRQYDCHNKSSVVVSKLCLQHVLRCCHRGRCFRLLACSFCCMLLLDNDQTCSSSLLPMPLSPSLPHTSFIFLSPFLALSHPTSPPRLLFCPLLLSYLCRPFSPSPFFPIPPFCPFSIFLLMPFSFSSPLLRHFLTEICSDDE